MFAIGFLLVLSACSGDGDPASSRPEPTRAEAVVPPGTATPEPAGTAGEPNDDSGAALETARAWIDHSSGLPAAVAASVEVDRVERTGNVSHVRFGQTHDGYRVDGGELIVHVLGDGTVQGATSSLSEADPAPGAALNTTREAAIAVATKAVTGSVQPGAETATVWVEDGALLRLAQRVDLTTLSPLSSWTVFVDATNGSVISAERVEARARPTAPGLRSAGAASGAAKSALAQPPDRCVLPPAPAACVFVPDPIYAAGGSLPSTSAANDFLTGVPLLGLDDPDSGALVGQYADLEPPRAPIDPIRQPDGLWGAGRGDAGFEAQNTYYWIDYGQRIVQRLGFDNILNSSFPVVPIDPDTVDNAFYSPGERRIYLGVGSNGIHEGEDATGILHEYGHALLDAVNPNLLSNGDIGAYHEAFGDIFAVLSTIEFRTGDWPCYFLWTDQVCVRRMDTTKVYPRDLVRQIHADGEIYSGAIADILAALLAADGIDIDDCPGSSSCDAVRDRVLTTVLASNYYLTENMSMPDIAGTFIEANEAQFGGADADLIEAAFEARGLTGGTGTLIDGGGVRNGDAAAVAVEVDIAHSYRGDLRVLVGVADADFDDLCTPISVFEPDESDDEHDLSGRIDISDTDCAPFAEPGPDRIWYLFVEDTLPDDDGEILGFSVVAGGETFLAPGLPLPIADADPTGSVALIDGSAETMSPATMSGFGSGGVGVGSVFVTASVTHGYQGDLSIRAGVVDQESTILCSVPIVESDPADAGSGTLSGDVDMDRCAEFFPPATDRQWFLHVTDTAAEDIGVIDAFSVTGPDGEVFEFTDVPVQVPDADVDGVALLLDGTGGSSGQAGGGGQGADMALPAVSVAVSHPYAGDIAMSGGVVDADGNVLCEVTLASPDATDDTVDPAGEMSLSECARFYPPEPDRRWFLFVADTLSDDVGAVESFSLAGPDGAVYTFSDLPVDVPDADPDGVVLYLDGSELGFGSMAEPVVNIVISHPYVGDLDLRVGVVDVDGETLCESQVAEADIANAAVDLSVDVALGECGDFYPPAPERRWFVTAVDNFEFDRGRIDAFVLFGPDGQAWRHPESAVPIPDDDPDGVTLAIDGRIGSLRGGVRSNPIVAVEIAHPYRGDLKVTVGVLDADQTILCEQVLLESDVADEGRDVSLEVPLAACAGFYPPTADTEWFLLVTDEEPADTGTIERFTVTGADGRVFDFGDVPVPIPDDDSDGVVLPIP